MCPPGTFMRGPPRRAAPSEVLGEGVRSPAAAPVRDPMREEALELQVEQQLEAPVQSVLVEVLVLPPERED